MDAKPMILAPMGTTTIQPEDYKTPEPYNHGD